MANQEEITQYNILQSLENGEQISQRQLSSQLGINVASINFAIKKEAGMIVIGKPNTRASPME